VNTQKILLIDDDRSFLTVTGLRLKQAGYAVVAAVDAVGAISTAVREAPDLILLDLGLPAGDGFVVMERLRANLALAGIPIIIVTARDATANREKARQEGAWGLLQKPVEPETLIGAVQSALGGPGHQVPPAVSFYT